MSRRFNATKILLFALFLSPVALGQAFRFDRYDFATGTYPAGMAVADFNGDGRLDVAVTDEEQQTITILLGQPNGTFAQQGKSIAQSFAGGIATGDFNGDGKVDLVAADWIGSSVTVFLGNGNGTFKKAGTSSVNYYASEIAVGDFNKDGKLDVAVTSNSAFGVSVLLGNGDGTFQPFVLYSTPSYSIGIVAADFNRDGKTDLAMADTDGNDAFVMLGNGDGTFQTGTSFPAGEVPVQLAVGDFNGDGYLDLAVSDGPDCGCAFMSILLGNGDETFQQPNTISTEGAGTIVAADFNRDNKADLAITESGRVSIFLGAGDGSFQPYLDYGSDGSAIGIVTGDFNRDGLIDMVVANFNGNNATHLSTLLGNGDGTFGNSAAYDVQPNPNGVAIADLNGDKRADIVTLNSMSNTVSVLLGTGAGKFGNATNYAVSSGQYGPVITSDFNNDGYPDIATVNYSAGTVSILMNQGNGTFGTYKDYPAGKNGCALAVGDFNKDGNIDLIVGSAAVGLSFLAGKGNGQFAAPVAFGSGLDPCSIAVADFNGDGALDVAAVANSFSSSTVSVLLGGGNGKFGSAVNYSVGGGTISVIAADVNKDGKADLAVLVGTAPDIAVLVGNGDGTFQNYIAYPAPPSPATMLAADFNGRGTLDLAITSALNSTLSIVPGSGTGGFGTPIQFYAGYYPTALAAGDLDGNGSNDLAIANGGNGTTVTVLLDKPVVSLSANMLSFPATAVGTKSVSQGVALYNPGSASVALRSIAITGSQSADFALTNNCAGSIGVGKTCLIQIVFQPTKKGIRSATLRFTDNALGGTQAVRLAGTGD